MKTNIVDVFCIIDDFSKLFDETIKKKTLEEADKKRRNRKFKMSDSEVMTILILFHLSRYRDLKAFYLQYITHSCRSEFPHLVSYKSLCGAAKQGRFQADSISQYVLFGSMYRHLFHRFHPIEGLSYQTSSWA